MKKLTTLLFIVLLSTMGYSQQGKSFEEVLKPYAERALQGIEKGVEYADEEIPVISQQYLMFEAIKAWSIVIILVLVFIFLIRHLINKHRDKDSYFYDDCGDLASGIPITIFGVFVLIASVIMFFINILTAIKVTFFPKLFLAEKFIELF